MATKVSTHELRIGMFVADLDRPWEDTPFLLQGFLVEDDEQIATLRAHCEYVIVDRARSTGDEYQAPPNVSVAANLERSGGETVVRRVTAPGSGKATGDVPPPEAPGRAPGTR